ncbi:Uma2 family endonuclease [Cronbergia sp. UHCC 0137]|uniref:Uma2 family endonuclease n=1 Tax=Cronbergia sp. UHCC 0137 TaxID=3110239 RepID=UPI002B202A1A|nr:Uma2 family endonuclease [Cronbergia sp. UHCC 0137]MEA5619079.1 Uma2 family endonuclease [Cronbergia sp. UHCC 0137]
MALTQPIIVPPTTSEHNHLQLTLPDHTQLPDSDGTFVKNFQEHPQGIILTTSIEPVLQKLHPDGNYCIGQDSGIYWHLTEPPEKGAEAPDWFYVPNVMPLLAGEYRRSYVLWKEIVAPLIAIEFVSGNGSEERDTSRPDDINEKTGENKKAGKFWVYEQAIRIPFYAIYEVKKAAVEVYHLVDGKYHKMSANERGHYPIPPMGVELGIQQDAPIPWLRWWNQDGEMLLTGNERAVQAEALVIQERIAKQEVEALVIQERIAKQDAEALVIQEREQKEKLAAYLQSIGINPADIP